MVGRLSFREDGDFIDCRRMGVGGKAIPPNIDKVRQGKGSGLPLACKQQRWPLQAAYRSEHPQSVTPPHTHTRILTCAP